MCKQGEILGITDEEFEFKPLSIYEHQKEYYKSLLEVLK